ncbi:MAG TPA: hypothetical protein PKM88_02325 [bacterium]|nr:hypothetical protein [bacterium]
MNRRAAASGLAIVLLAACLRLVNLDYCEFKSDEASNAFAARTVIATGNPAAASVPTSIGGVMPPLFNLLLVLPFTLSPSPVFATQLVALANTAAVGLLFVLALRWFGLRTAIIAGLLFAVNPWSVLYARKIWHQDLVAPLAVMVGWFLFRVVIDRKAAALVPLAGLLALVPQFHATAWGLTLTAALALATGAGRVPARYWTGAAVLFAGVAALPWLLDPIGSTANLRALRAYATHPWLFDREAFLAPLRLATGVGFGLSPTMVLPGIAQFLLAVGLFVLVAVRCHRPENRILLCWLAGPVAIGLTSRITPPHHYFLALLPVLPLLLAVGLTESGRETGGGRGALRQWTAGTVAAALVIAQLWLSGTFFVRDLPRATIIARMDYGRPLAVRVAAVRAALADGERDPVVIHQRLQLALPGVGPDELRTTAYLVQWLGAGSE